MLNHIRLSWFFARHACVEEGPRAAVRVVAWGLWHMPGDWWRDRRWRRRLKRKDDVSARHFLDGFLAAERMRRYRKRMVRDVD